MHCAVIEHVGIDQNTREVLGEARRVAECFSALLECSDQSKVLYNFTVHSGQVFYFFYKIQMRIGFLVELARALCSEGARASANQSARYILVIL